RANGRPRARKKRTRSNSPRIMKLATTIKACASDALRYKSHTWLIQGDAEARQWREEATLTLGMIEGAADGELPCRRLDDFSFYNSQREVCPFEALDSHKVFGRGVASDMFDGPVEVRSGCCFTAFRSPPRSHAVFLHLPGASEAHCAQ